MNTYISGSATPDTGTAPSMPFGSDQLDRYRHWATTPLNGAPVISVVIPTYNEQERILPTIGAIASHLCHLGRPWELIVSDDGSSDATRRLVQQLGLANTKVIETDANTGKGGAVRRGVQAAGGDFILFADADQATPIEQFELLFTPVASGAADVAIGSRAASGADVTGKSLARRMMSGGLRGLVRFGFGLSYEDTQCGFKLFSREAADRLFSAQRIEGFSFDLELLYIASHSGIRVTETPVRWFDSPGSTVNGGRDTLRFLRDLSRIRLHAALGHYNETKSPTGGITQER